MLGRIVLIRSFRPFTSPPVTLMSADTRSNIAASIVLAVLGLMAFWPSVAFDFVNWDDPAYVLHNDLIKSWSPSNLYGVATETVTRNYAPLTIFSLLVDHSLWSMNPSGYHATNVLLHVINGVLVFFLLKQLSGSRFVAFTAAALFLVHPVQIETVAWISSRKGLLSAMFMLAALLVRLKPDRPGHDGWYVLWLAAALMSKALAVVVPPIVLCYDLWVRKEEFSKAFARQIIPGVMCLLLLLKTMAAQHTVLGGVRGHLEYSLLHIIAIDTMILWKYIGMLFYPVNLSVLYDPPTTNIAVPVAIASVGWLLVAAVVWKTRHRFPLVLWSAGCFLLLLFPVLNFFRITTLMNDRYLYLPSIAVFAVAAAAFERVFAWASSGSIRSDVLKLSSISLKWSLSVTAVVAAMALTAQHLPVWQNATTLWTHTMQAVPQIPVVRIQMAYTLHDQGQSREAVRTLQRALLETEPDQLDRKRMVTAIREWSHELSARSAARVRARR